MRRINGNYIIDSIFIITKKLFIQIDDYTKILILICAKKVNRKLIQRK